MPMKEIPEWFKITEDDKKPVDLQPKKRLFKYAALTAPLLLVGAVVFGDSDKAEAEQATVNSTALAPTTNSSIAIPASDTGSVPRTITSKVASTVSFGIANPVSTNSTPGVGVPMPSANNDREDGDDDGDDDDSFGDDDDSFGEHHEQSNHESDEEDDD